MDRDLVKGPDEDKDERSYQRFIKTLWVLFGVCCVVMVVLFAVGIPSCDLIIYFFLLAAYLIFITLLTIGSIRRER